MKILYAINCDEIKVSDCDFLFLAGYNWYYNPNKYYCCTYQEIWNGKQIHNKPMHWFVAQLMKTEISEGWEIDHIDRDRANNQRSNLRAASKKLNGYNVGKRSHNTSGFVGVSFKADRIRAKPWVAQLQTQRGQSNYLGVYATAEEASEVYQAAKVIRDKKEEDRCQCLLTPRP